MIQDFYMWSAKSWLAEIVGRHQYTFALLEVVHLFGLVLFLGGIVLLSLRLMGMGMVGGLSIEFRNIKKCMAVGLYLLILSGICLFANEAKKLYQSPIFTYKMIFFVLAMIFHYSIFRMITSSDSAAPWKRWLAGIFALTLWFSVAIAGRAIGFF